jgi:AP-1 complex subunit gamma-1
VLTQAAVPKFMQLKLDPASGTALPPLGGVVRQVLHVNNSMHGQKPLVMKLRVGYTLDGASRLELVEVKNLPSGL